MHLLYLFRNNPGQHFLPQQVPSVHLSACPMLLLLLHITLPIAVNIRCSVDGVDKAVDQVLFAAQLDAGVNRPIDASQHAFVLAVRFMVLHDKHQNVVDVDLHLPDELDLEGNIIVDVFFVSIRFRAIRLMQYRTQWQAARQRYPQ